MAEASTGSDGVAVFIAEEGTYLVTASKSGYVTHVVEVAVNMDVTVEITLIPVSGETLVPMVAFVGVGLTMLSLV